MKANLVDQTCELCNCYIGPTCYKRAVLAIFPLASDHLSSDVAKRISRDRLCPWLGLLCYA